MGKFDPSLIAKSVVVNGVNVRAQAGQANFSFGAGNVGEHPITGSFNFDENDKVVRLPIKDKYVFVESVLEGKKIFEKLFIVSDNIVASFCIKTKNYFLT